MLHSTKKYQFIFKKIVYISTQELGFLELGISMIEPINVNDVSQNVQDIQARSKQKTGKDSAIFSAANSTKEKLYTAKKGETKQKENAKNLKENFKKTKSEQGLIGKCWNGIKNLFGMKTGSKHVEKTIEKFEKGEISEEAAKEVVESYQNGQKQCVDIAADVVSGVAAFATFAACTGLGIAASPFTGGASLGLVAVGLGAAAAAGTATKILVKGADAMVGGREYDSLAYDAATGGVNGLMAPVTAGVGGAVGKVIATRLGVSAINAGGKILLKEGLESTTKGALTRTLLTTNISYTGGNLMTRSAALGTDMAVNGSLTGAFDSGTRYLADGREGKSLIGFVGEVSFGGLGGLIAAPIIGGGMRFTGKAVGKVTGKIQDRIHSSYEKAVKNLQNVQDGPNPDIEVLKELLFILNSTKNTGKNIANKFEDHMSSIAGKMPETELYSNLPKELQEVLLESGMLIKNARTIRNNTDFDINQANLGEFIARLSGKIEETGNSPEMQEAMQILSNRWNKLLNNKNFHNMAQDEQMQTMIEEANILFAKFAQTYSSETSLPPEVQQLFKKFTSNCSVSRNLKEAQELANTLYDSKYTIVKAFGAGTIGEAYLARTTNGDEVVIKMLKNGMTPERLSEDRKIFINYITKMIDEPKEKAYKLKLLNGLFDSWEKELDFGLEAQSAKEMAHKATQFNVAQAIEVGSKNGRNISLVLEKAEGVRLDNLIDMIKVYKKDPAEYLRKYATEIEANPWLKTPETWIESLPAAYQKAQNEQILFVSPSGEKVVHADPHTGNIFVDFDTAKGKSKITYIDTGNVAKRTNDDIIQDISLYSSLLIGNSEGVANALLHGAELPSDAAKEELAKQFAQMLDKRLFNAGVNLQNTAYTQGTINDIMKELKIVPAAHNTNLMKATVQRIKTLREICEATGIAENKHQDVKELMYGISQAMATKPKETLKQLLPLIKWAYKNNEQTLTTFFHMLMKNNQPMQKAA